MLSSNRLTPDCDGWPSDGVTSTPSPSSSKASVGSGVDEEASCEQRSITETVINGSMKETVSLTVDAKTETAVFKRLDTNGHTTNISVLMSTDAVESVSVPPTSVVLLNS